MFKQKSGNKMKVCNTVFSSSILGTIALWMVGCTAPDMMVFPKVALREVTVSASKNANREHVTLVHFVFPKSTDLYNELKKMDAQAYFAAAEQLIHDHPNDLEIIPIEIVPGMTITQEVKLKTFDSRAALVFARYEDEIPGLHREELRDLCKKVRILLGRAGFTVIY